MALVISLDVLPADLPVHDVAAMVEACSGALAEGRCAMAADLPESSSPAAVALVLWQGQALRQVTVRVGRGGGQWVVRALTFSDEDSVSERWTTVGLTVATLVGERAAPDAPPEEVVSAEPAPVSVKPAPAAPSAPPSTPRRRIDPRSSPSGRWLGAFGMLAGPGWSDSDWQRGAWLALAFRMQGLPLQAHALGSYATSQGPILQDERVHTRWLTASLGLGLFGRWPHPFVASSVGIEAAYRRVTAELNGRERAAHDLPIRLRVTASAPGSGLLGGTVGVALRLPPDSSPAAESSTLRGARMAFEALAGLEVRL